MIHDPKISQNHLSFKPQCTLEISPIVILFFCTVLLCSKSRQCAISKNPKLSTASMVLCSTGRCLNFSAMMVLVLMLRYSLTRIRNLGLSTILPLDHHVYLHKLTGVVILVLAWIHTLSHLINFGVNVQPDPVKFVQLTYKYLEDNIIGDRA